MRDLAGAMEGLEGKTLKKNVKLEKSQRPKGGSTVGVKAVTGRNQTVGVPLNSGLHRAGNREVFQRKPVVATKISSDQLPRWAT